ncbi:MAG: hypothetical protein GEU90_20930 [Gemmatimonas sp.]|nr:hypothetical protein [Gemmatimonas sp.]
MLRTALALLALALLELSVASSTGAAQNVLDRTPLLSGGWVGTPGSLAISAPFRFSSSNRPDTDVFVVPTLEASFGLPRHALVGARYAAQSPLFDGESDWEVFGRYRPLRQFEGAPVDATLQLGFNGGAESVDVEVSVARWFGGLRLLGASRFFNDAFDSGDVGGAFAGGAVFYPKPRALPLAFTADAGVAIDGDDDAFVWSAGLLVGIPYAINTLSLFATNTRSGTLQGVSAGGDRTRWGLELTLPIPLGRLLEWYTPREQAMEAVVELQDAPSSTMDADIFRFAFPNDRVEIPAGTTIRWTNRDDVVHTVSADDGSWDSAAILPGQTWSATFEEPGIYPFHCGPHPFMKGTVIVR